MLKNNPIIQCSFVNNHINYQFLLEKASSLYFYFPLQINTLHKYDCISSYRTHINNTQITDIRYEWKHTNSIDIQGYNIMESS